jgi:predicted DNA-binding transcriptional regulator AlpA
MPQVIDQVPLGTSTSEPTSTLSSHETARRVGLNIKTVRARVRQGTFPRPVSAPGKAWRFSIADIDRYVRAQAAASRPAVAAWLDALLADLSKQTRFPAVAALASNLLAGEAASSSDQHVDSR